jgi:pSer/pThr/pTyr-binding forkhead associated (FHA) protein
MAMLVQVIDGVVGNKFTLDKKTHTIGRNPKSDIFLDDISVSSQHAVIDAKEQGYFDGYCDFTIRDLNSTNGTYVNDERIAEKKLVNGDIVNVAWNTFRFIDDNEMNLEKTIQILHGSTR